MASARCSFLVRLLLLLALAGCAPDSATRPAQPDIVPSPVVAPANEETTPAPQATPVRPAVTPDIAASTTVVRIGVWHARYESVVRWAQNMMARTPGVTLEVIDKHAALDSLIESSERAVVITDVVAIALDDVDIALGIPSSFTDHLSDAAVCPVSSWLDASRHAALLDPSLTRAFQRDASIFGAPIGVQIPLLSVREHDDPTLATRRSWNRLVDGAAAERPIAAIGGVGTLWLGMMEEGLGEWTETVDPSILNSDLFQKTTIRLRRAVLERRVLMQRGEATITRTVVWSDLEYPIWQGDAAAESITRSALPPGTVANALMDVYALVLPAPCPPSSSRVVDIAAALLSDIDAIADIGRNPALRTVPAAPETRQVWKERTPLLNGERDAYDLMIARVPDVHPSSSWRLLAGIVTEAIFAPDIVSDDDVMTIIRARWEEMSGATVLD